ncbi:MAG: hypothetical protein EZS28_018700 [Streblomastix strix]|uniref:B30.2/SPRY domain-containing protein n=1 Tax=Streblomastix strix TaxID=222440 RepID=A0A5J4VT40_9EUKA|nr:MAG: hypothetical protein EZS28_018700 [Streblomastix strix]
MRFQIQLKDDAVKTANKAEENLKIQIEKRRAAEKETSDFKWENDDLKKKDETLTQEYESEKDSRMVFEVKFNAEVQEKEKIEKQFAEKFEQMNIMHNKEIKEIEHKRQESEFQQKKEKELKEKALKRAETAEKTIAEQVEYIQIAQYDEKIRNEEFQKMKQIVEQQTQKANEEEKRRNQAEILKGEIQRENFNLKRENERIQYEVGRLKEKFGEEKFDEEKQVIEKKEKEKEDEIQQLKEENENQNQRANNVEERIKKIEQEKIKEIQEKNNEKKRADSAEQTIRKIEQEKENERTDKQKEIQEKNKEQRRAVNAEERIKRLEQEKQKEIQEKQRQQKRAEEAEIRARKFEEEMQKEKMEKQRKEQELKKLRDEIEKIKSNIPKDFPIAIINPDQQDFDFADIDGNQKKIIKKTGRTQRAVSLTQVLEHGIWELEVQFSNGGNNGGIGIIRDTYILPAGTDPTSSPHHDHAVAYTGQGWGNCIHYKGTRTSGNTLIQDNQIIKVEYNSEKGALIFFVDGVQQPVYIAGIKEKIRFIICLFYAGATCTIRSLKKLTKPTSGHLPNEKAVQW